MASSRRCSRDSGLTNQTTYYYRVRATGLNTTGPWSSAVKAKPMPPPPSIAPTPLGATPGNARVVLTWAVVPGVTGYRGFYPHVQRPVRLDANRVDIEDDVHEHWARERHDVSLHRGGVYGIGGIGPKATPVSATPVAPPPASTGLTATAGNHEVILAWTAAPGAASYDIFKATASGRQGRTPVMSGLTVTSFTDLNLENGPTLYYKVRAVNAGGTSPLSTEAGASPEGAPLVVDPETTAAFQFLRQATWGPKPQDVNLLKGGGREAFIESQIAAPASAYPDALLSMPIEAVQEQMMANALTGARSAPSAPRMGTAQDSGSFQPSKSTPRRGS
ncbi:MAG: fibronectin type III domain-containing protein [Vicinamibacterales bacterium]